MLARALLQEHVQAATALVIGQQLATQRVQLPEHAATHKATTHHAVIHVQHITAAAKAHKLLQAALAEAQAAVIQFRQQAARRAATQHHRAVQAVREAVQATKVVHRQAQAAAVTNRVVAVHLQGAVVAVAIRLHRVVAQAVAIQAGAALAAVIQAEAAQAPTAQAAALRAVVAHHHHHHQVADVNTKA